VINYPTAECSVEVVIFFLEECTSLRMVDRNILLFIFLIAQEFMMKSVKGKAILTAQLFTLKMPSNF